MQEEADVHNLYAKVLEIENFRLLKIQLFKKKEAKKKIIETIETNKTKELDDEPQFYTSKCIHALCETCDDKKKRLLNLITEIII